MLSTEQQATLCNSSLIYRALWESIAAEAKLHRSINVMSSTRVGKSSLIPNDDDALHVTSMQSLGCTVYKLPGHFDCNLKRRETGVAITRSPCRRRCPCSVRMHSRGGCSSRMQIVVGETLWFCVAFWVFRSA